MNRIIVPLDGSMLAERALGLAGMFARSYNARIELIHVLEEPIAFDLMPGMLVTERADVERYLQRVVEQLPADLSVTSYVIRGEPVHELLELTISDTDSMFVMSTHGRGGLGRLMFGSVSDKLLRHSSVPVALIRSPVELRHHSFTNILVPLDDAQYAESALPIALDLAIRSDATVGLLRVCEPFWNSPYVATAPEFMYFTSDQVSELEQACLDDARRYLNLIADRGRAEGARLVWEVRSGKPADEIIRAAETTGADLIVLSTHGRGGVRRLALGSVTNEVLHRGTTPILALPPRAVERESEQLVERDLMLEPELLSTM
jgi:nucleotide-binding universal stress UspA family protein